MDAQMQRFEPDVVAENLQTAATQIKRLNHHPEFNGTQVILERIDHLQSSMDQIQQTMVQLQTGMQELFGRMTRLESQQAARYYFIRFFL